MSDPQNQRFELGSIEVMPDGESFVLGLVDSNEEIKRVELPRWTIHQLMRMLPRLDATLVQARSRLTSDLVAYGVVQWSVERTGADRAVAMSMQDERWVESAFLLSAGDAEALHCALGEALESGSDEGDDRAWADDPRMSSSQAAA
jgi:hypothetical protein